MFENEDLGDDEEDLTANTEITQNYSSSQKSYISNIGSNQHLEIITSPRPEKETDISFSLLSKTSKRRLENEQNISMNEKTAKKNKLTSSPDITLIEATNSNKTDRFQNIQDNTIKDFFENLSGDHLNEIKKLDVDLAIKIFSNFKKVNFFINLVYIFFQNCYIIM